MERVLEACLRSPATSFEMLRYEASTRSVGALDVNLLAVLSRTLDSLPLADLADDLAAFGPRLLVRGPEFDRLHAALPLSRAQSWLPGALTAGLRLQDLLDDAGSSAGAVLRAVWLMVELGVAATVEAAPSLLGGHLHTGSFRPASLALPADAPPGDLPEAARALLMDHVRLAWACHYQVLDVVPMAEAEEIEAGWKRRSAAWRPLATDEALPVEVRVKARDLLARAAEAREVLLDSERRWDFDLALGFRDGGLPLGSELESLLQGRRALSQGRWSEAIQYFRSVLHEQPRAMEALLGLARALREHRDLGPAGRYEVGRILSRAAEIAPGDPRLAAARRA